MAEDAVGELPGEDDGKEVLSAATVLASPVPNSAWALLSPPPPVSNVETAISGIEDNIQLENYLPELNSSASFDLGDLETLPELSSGIFDEEEDGVQPSRLPTANGYASRRRVMRGQNSNLESLVQFDSLCISTFNLPTFAEEEEEQNIPLGRDLTNSQMFPLTRSAILPVLPDDEELMSNPHGDGITRKCRVCDTDLTESCCFVAGFHLHRKCLKCKKCRIPLSESTCVSYKGEFYCRECTSLSVLCRCSVCWQNIDPLEQRISLANGKTLHKKCLCCYSCSNLLSVDDYELIDNTVFCRSCANETRKRECRKCGSVVISDGVKRCGRWFHKEHFQCERCGVILKGNMFVAHHGRFFCMKHGHVFSHSCAFCKAMIRGPEESHVMWNNMMFHTECLICRICGVPLNPLKVEKFHNRPHCSECYEMRMEEEACDTHKHSVVKSVERKKRYVEQGLTIVEEPQYTGVPMSLKFDTVTEDQCTAEEFEPVLYTVASPGNEE